MRDYEQQTWRPRPTCISALQHFVTSDVVAVAVALPGRSTERPLEDAAGNRLMKAAEEPSERLHAASPHHGLYIRLTKWQSSREEASQHPFQMGTVTPNGQCDASAEPEHSVAHRLQRSEAEMQPKMQQGAVLHREKSGPSRLKRDHICLSLTAIIPFNPFELMSSFTAGQPPHPATLTYRRGAWGWGGWGDL